jgi:hypothetical protein
MAAAELVGSFVDGSHGTMRLHAPDADGSRARLVHAPGADSAPPTTLVASTDLLGAGPSLRSKVVCVPVTESSTSDGMGSTAAGTDSGASSGSSVAAVLVVPVALIL